MAIPAPHNRCRLCDRIRPRCTCPLLQRAVVTELHQIRVARQQMCITETGSGPRDPDFNRGPTSGLSCSAGSLSPSWFVHVAHCSHGCRSDLPPPQPSLAAGKLLATNITSVFCCFFFSLLFQKTYTLHFRHYGFNFHITYAVTDTSQPRS